MGKKLTVSFIPRPEQALRVRRATYSISGAGVAEPGRRGQWIDVADGYPICYGRALMRFALLAAVLLAVAFAFGGCGDDGESRGDIDAFLAEMSRARAATERPGQVLHVRRTRFVESSAFTYLDEAWVDIAAAESRLEVTAGEGVPGAGAWAVTVCQAGRCWVHSFSGLVRDSRESPRRALDDVLLHILTYLALADPAILEQALDPWPTGGVDPETGWELRSIGGSTRVQQGRWDGQPALVLRVDTAYTMDGHDFHSEGTVYLDPQSYLPLGEVEGAVDLPGAWRQSTDYEVVEFLARDSLPADFFDPTVPAAPSR